MKKNPELSFSKVVLTVILASSAMMSCSHNQLAQRGIAQATEADDEPKGFSESQIVPIDFTKKVPDYYCRPIVKGVGRPGNYEVTLPFSSSDPMSQDGEVQGFILKDGHAGESYKISDEESISPERKWEFKFYERSSEIALQVSDWAVKDWLDPKTKKVIDRSPNGSTTIVQYTFFPRKNFPAIKLNPPTEGSEDGSIEAIPATLQITLPTGESFELDAETHKVLWGVFKETPLKLGGVEGPMIPTKVTLAKLGKDEVLPTTLKKLYGTKPVYDLLSQKHFVNTQLNYQGEGVYIEDLLFSTNDDTRLPGHKIKIRKPTVTPDCKAGEACSTCVVDSADIWVKNEENCFRLKFQTDEEFDQYLARKCKFRLFY